LPGFPAHVPEVFLVPRIESGTGTGTFAAGRPCGFSSASPAPCALGARCSHPIVVETPLFAGAFLACAYNAGHCAAPDRAIKAETASVAIWGLILPLRVMGRLNAIVRPSFLPSLTLRSLELSPQAEPFGCVYCLNAA